MYAQTSAYSERKDAGLSGLFADEIRTAKRTAKRTTTRTAMRVITEFGCPARRGGETQLLPVNYTELQNQRVGCVRYARTRLLD